MQILTNAIDEIIDKKSLIRKIRIDKKLRIKLGVDPSAPDLHLGHYIVLNQLKKFNDAGHKIIFLIGDATAKIGDPSGRNVERPVLTDLQIKNNVKTYIDQVGLVLDTDSAEVRYNSEWYSKMDFYKWLEIAGGFSVNQLIERDDFNNRLKRGLKLSVQEMMYPMMQAYDSVQLKADIEIGGTDQKFNMLIGRALQRKMDLPEQDIITMQLLVGTDGKKKMSKSVGNYIGLTDVPEEMFGKIMSIPDSIIPQYARLILNKSMADLAQLAGGDHPMACKQTLAHSIVELFYRGSGRKAQEQFTRVYSHKKMPSDTAAVSVDADKSLKEILINRKIVESVSELRRLVSQRAVKSDGQIIALDEIYKPISPGEHNIKIGKRRFLKIIK